MQLRWSSMGWERDSQEPQSLVAAAWGGYQDMPRRGEDRGAQVVHERTFQRLIFLQRQPPLCQSEQLRGYA